MYDENRLEGLLDGWAAETDTGRVEGGLRFDGTRVIEVEPRTGTGLVRDPGPSRTRRACSPAAIGRSCTLPVGTLKPAVDAAAVKAAAARARRLLAHDVTLVIGPSSVVVTPAQLATALGTRVAGHDLLVTVRSRPAPHGDQRGAGAARNAGAATRRSS